MYTMSHQTQFAYATPPQQQQPARQYGSHGTSSAFSSSANPDEDWTKISDLAERRRIQNRIAQRNYRKKLKRRLEDLERRAGSSDEPSSEEKQPSPAKPNNKKSTSGQKAQKQQQQQQQQQQPQPQHSTVHVAPMPSTQKHQQHIPQSQFTPPMHADDEYLFPSQPYNERERSHTPPLFAYSSYPPPPEDVLLAPYHHQQHHHQAYRTPETYQDYTVPVTLPSMTHFSDAVKRETVYGEDVGVSPYVTYGSYLPGLSSPYDNNTNPHTPPLSHSFEHSTNCSDAGSYEGSYDYPEYPTTPLSMPDSPHMVQ